MVYHGHSYMACHDSKSEMNEINTFGIHDCFVYPSRKLQYPQFRMRTAADVNVGPSLMAISHAGGFQG